MFRDRRGLPVLDYWPTRGSVDNHATGERGRVANAWAALVRNAHGYRADSEGEHQVQCPECDPDAPGDHQRHCGARYEPLSPCTRPAAPPWAIIVIVGLFLEIARLIEVLFVMKRRG